MTRATSRARSPREELPAQLPLVGRADEFERVLSHLRADLSRGPGTLLLRGDAGVGKTRLIRECIDAASSDGARVFHGRAFPLDGGLSYAVVADAMVGFLRDAEASTLQTLTRGRLPELYSLFPGAAPSDGVPAFEPVGAPDETRATLFWTFAELLRGLARRNPVLLIAEDLQWADPASLRLLHFAVRRLEGEPIRFLFSSTEGLRADNPDLLEFETSLTRAGLADSLVLRPLGPAALRTLVTTCFDVSDDVCNDFADRLCTWSGGNPLFATQTLRALVENGDLRRRNGTWLGWEVGTFEPPSELQDLVEARISRLSPGTREILETAAAMGDRIDFDALKAVVDADVEECLAAVDELVRRGILAEQVGPSPPARLEFTHPLVRECLYDRLGSHRARLLHRRIGDALERDAREFGDERAEQLAYHFHRSGDRSRVGKAIEYLLHAGRKALERHANEEAARHLGAAIGLLGEEQAEIPRESATRLGSSWVGSLADHARALERLGRFDEAAEAWKRALRADAAHPSDLAGPFGPADSSDPASAERSWPTAELRRRLALACFRAGRHLEALTHYATALDEAEGDPLLEGRIRLARAHCFQEMAKWDEAADDAESALRIGRDRDAAGIRARAHQALALHRLWTGRPDEARTHALDAIAEAESANDPVGAFRSHWGLGVLHGLTGNLEEARNRIAQARRLAEDLGSPVLRAWVDELVVQEAYGRGAWDTSISAGEKAIAEARTLGQRSLRSRLLVWTALPLFGRGELERGRALVAEACEVAGLDGLEPGGGGLDLHAAVPAYTGRVALHLAEGDMGSAVTLGERGLELAYRNGSAIWSIHHLIPLLIQAYLWAGELDGARAVGTRLRNDAERMDHKLGLAWAEAGDALVTWLSGDIEGGSVRLRAAADQLDRIPVVYDAARLRRQLAGRLAELGRTEDALDELRRAHAVFLDLGAEPELQKARGMFRELDARPPRSGGAASGVEELSDREMEIARLVSRRRSNKAIAGELGISPRTVTTHLTNIYSKLELESRGALIDLVRESGWDEDGPAGR